MALFRCGGGGGTITLDRLCYINYRGKDTTEIPPISSADYGTNYSEYLSYDSTTKKFTVLKSFHAEVVTWVYQYGTAQGTNAQGQFIVNGTTIASYSCATRMKGEREGTCIYVKFNAGDIFWNYTPSSAGYPQQRLKIYRLENETETEMNNINTAIQFADENA